MENILIFVIIMIMLELFEVQIQRSDTLYGVVERLYRWYSKSIFLFFLIHPSLYFALFVAIAIDTFNIYMLSILTLKIFDLFYKIELIKKIFIIHRIPADLEAMLEWKIPSFFFFTGVLLYPPLIFYALINRF